MNILDNFLILSLIVLSFIAGLKLGEYYRNKAEAEKKEALEKQFLRLRVRADADDPVKPYGTPRCSPPMPVVYPTGDYDGDGPITEEFMTKLRENKQACTKFNKSDLAK